MNDYLQHNQEEQEENWRGPGAREGEATGEIWIGPEAGMSRRRPLKVTRMMRGPGHVELGENALSDARLDAREDARARDMPDVCERTLQRLAEDFDYADVSHPHGEALGPGAQTHCTGREKNAFGGMHPQYYYAGPQDQRSSRSRFRSRCRSRLLDGFVIETENEIKNDPNYEIVTNRVGNRGSTDAC